MIGDETQFWSVEKASNGQKYYFNKKTKESQWDKPECLKTAEEKENQTDWIECTKSDGRVFYYNTVTKKSQWMIPPELKLLRQQQAEKRRIRESQGGNFDDDTNVISDELKKELDQKNFLEMLRENKVTLTTKWDNAQKQMQNDTRWNQIKQISEKKRLFQEYIQKIKRQERQDQLNKTEKAKEDFFRMLEEANLTSDAKFYKVFSSICSDQRYRTLEEKNREAYFQEYLDRLAEQENDQAKEDRRVHGDSLKKKISLMIESSTKYRWSEFTAKFSSDEDFKKLSDYDRLCVFSDAMYELECAENEERRKTKRKTERTNRENFRELLKAKIALGQINHKTKWRNFVQSIKDTPEFLNMLGQTGSLPHELFEDQQDLLIDNHKAMKAEIKLHIKSSGMKVVADISYNEFIEKMRALSVFDTLEEYLKNFYYHYFIQKAMVKEKETQKKHKKAQRKFLRFLGSISSLTKDSQLRDVSEIVTKGLGEEINSLIPIAEREQIFKAFVATLDPNYKDSFDRNQQDSQERQYYHGNGSAHPHSGQSLRRYEPSPGKRIKTLEEGEEGEISEDRRRRNFSSADPDDDDHEEGEDEDEYDDSDSDHHKSRRDSRRPDNKDRSSRHHHSSRHSPRSSRQKQSSRRNDSRSNSRQRQDRKSHKKDKKRSRKGHRSSRSPSSSR